MPTQTHVHEEVFSADPETMFDLLLRPSAIRAWWGASRVIVLAEEGGTWAAAWGEQEDDPDYITVARIKEFVPPERLVLKDYRYASKDGPLPFEATFETTFLVSSAEEGTRLRVEQSGFPVDQPGFLESCVQGWTDTFAGIRRFLAS